MDFLDPYAKRNHRIRLAIGYGLMAALIAIGTMILVFQAYGFGVDRKTGEVIQNGLVFVDSAPDNAKILLNGQEYKERTNSRMALPSGKYNLQIQKDSYREWKRSFELEGGAVERFNYPILILNKLERQEIKSFEAAPAFGVESPDRKWAIISQGDSLTSFIEYDLNAITNKKPDEKALVFPGELFTQAAGKHDLQLIEWATDSKHMLVKHAFAGGQEFIILAREDPQSSLNINKHLGQNPTSVTLIDKKFDQWHLYTQQGGVLSSSDAKTRQIVPIASNITAFKSHGSDTLLYAQSTPDKKVQRVSLQQGKEVYTLRNIPVGAALLEIARYDGAWYVVVGSDAEHKTYVYQNPMKILSKRAGTKATPSATLKAAGPISQVSFSQNTRFVLAQSGQHFEVFDAEEKESFRYNLPAVLAPNVKVVWMDGHRLLANSAGKAIVFDYDGLNRQELVPSIPGLPVIFDRDFKILYSLDHLSANPTKTGLMRTALRLEQDL